MKVFVKKLWNRFFGHRGGRLIDINTTTENSGSGTGDYNLRFNLQNMTESIWTPIRENERGIDMTEKVKEDRLIE